MGLRSGPTTSVTLRLVVTTNDDVTSPCSRSSMRTISLRNGKPKKDFEQCRIKFGERPAGGGVEGGGRSDPRRPVTAEKRSQGRTWRARGRRAAARPELGGKSMRTDR